MHKFKTARPKSLPAVDRMIEDMGNSLSYIFLCVIYDKMTDGAGNNFQGKSMIKLGNFHNYVNEEKANWPSQNSREIIDYIKEKRGFIYESSLEIPFSQYLTLTKINGNRMAASPELKMYLQCGYLIISLWADEAVKKHYRMNLEQRKELQKWVVYYIDSIARGYTNCDAIDQMFIEELGWSIKKGKAVKA